VFIGGEFRDTPYADRRDRSFFLAVNCTDPGATCFCASMGSGPRCTAGYDLAVTELAGGFVVEVGSPRGEEVLEEAGSREATDDEEALAAALVREASSQMGREVETGGLRNLLYRNRSHPQWSDVAERCLTCGNCTAVCPTCFCHDVVDTPVVTGETVRDREWASCFSEEFSHLTGHGPIRASREARYRQWLTHKFAGWFDQFGTSGCVGCGRCITWCPAAIDITEELAAIRRTDQAQVPA
jgi:ferredoxin